MKHILDTSFRYRPSFETDVRKTFEKVRREIRARQPEAAAERPMKLVHLRPDEKQRRG